MLVENIIIKMYKCINIYAKHNPSKCDKTGTNTKHSCVISRPMSVVSPHLQAVAPIP